MWTIRGIASAVALTCGLGTAAAGPDPDGSWSLGVQTGVMTDDRASEALNPARVRFVDEYLAGFLLGYDRQIGASRFSLGVEAQLNFHFGSQSFYEVVLPVSLRYHPENSWWNAFDSFAFGLGLSHYSKISDLERENYDGTSRRNLVYWYLETEFAELDDGGSLFARLHHRSNAFDLVTPNGGSNALVLGFRRDF